MRLLPTELRGAFFVEDEVHRDLRGSFARTFDAEVFRARGLDPSIAQCSVSYNARKGTLRGMHYQRAPHAESKLVRCLAGRVYDVLLDLREGPTFGQWMKVVLSADDGRSLFIPPGVAHGFQTLVDGAVVGYQISVPHSPDHSAGVRWNDPRFGIRWPLPEPILSERDARHPDFLERMGALACAS